MTTSSNFSFRTLDFVPREYESFAVDNTVNNTKINTVGVEYCVSGGDG